MIELMPGVAIDEEELRFQASRSGGPGGQNVNKVATRVTVFFDVADSPGLTAEQKARITERLATRMSHAGILRVSCQTSRSQAANREEATARLLELVRGALTEQAERRPTRPRRAARERRILEKKRRGAAKRERAAARSTFD